MNEEKQQNKEKVIFLQTEKDGRPFGSGEWVDGVQVYVKNFRKKNGVTYADVDTKTTETYTNKNGEERFKHRTIGCLRIDNGEADIVVELYSGSVEKRNCSVRKVTGKKNGKEYTLLDFSDASANPYEKAFEDGDAGDDIPF